MPLESVGFDTLSGPVTSTVAPGNSAPVESVTDTSMRPVKTCAEPGTARASTASSTDAGTIHFFSTFFIGILPPGKDQRGAARGSRNGVLCKRHDNFVTLFHA